ncbi:MAG: hypothetical protein WCO56_23760 [Verrucomicrobiota bacterium]
MLALHHLVGALSLAWMLNAVLPVQAAEALSWRAQIEADWLIQDDKRLAAPVSGKPKSAVTQGSRSYPLALVLERGLQLAQSQRRLGVNVETAEQELRDIAAAVQQLPTDAPEAARRELYLRAHWVVRKLALGNPLLDFDTLLFVKRAPGTLPHMSDQHYGWWSRPGGGIYLLKKFKTGQPELRCLTSDMPPGSFIGPDLSYDGKKVLFAYCKYYPATAAGEKTDKSKLPEDGFYKIFEMNVNGGKRRQLTFGRYDDFDPRYLPNGEIVFLSTRKSTAIQCTALFSDSSRTELLPDSYVRCGGDNIRPCAVFTLHGMDAQGRNVRPLSAFENFEWTPSVMSDGRIVYARWDYIDRFNGHFESLWSANPDGTNPQLVYGNYTVKPQAVFEARSIPHSSKLVFTACAHHSITGGSLCLLDRTRGTEEETPLVRLTPEVVFPETEGWNDHYYANPWPLSEEYFLCGWATHRLPPHAGSKAVMDARNPVNAMGVYLYDAFGNLELLHRDPEISSMYPLPVKPRPRPVTVPSSVAWQGAQEGAFFLQDVYRGLDGVPRGVIKQLRLVGVVPKVQPHMNRPQLSVSAEDPGKFILGTVPVETDGSAYFRAPSGVPLFFQALDADGLVLQTMRTLTYVMPGQTLSCIGCHEHRDAAPLTSPTAAWTHAPSRIKPGPSGTWPLRFDQLVQPVLDCQCVTCHQPGSQDAAAARLDLTPVKAYTSLLAFGGGDLKQQAFERDRSIVGRGTCANSKLWKLLTQDAGHYQVRLDADARQRLATWMDTYAHRVGHFSDQQERDLAALREAWSHDLLEK